jgi:hypothetical protein
MDDPPRLPAWARWVRTHIVTCALVVFMVHKHWHLWSELSLRAATHTQYARKCLTDGEMFTMETTKCAYAIAQAQSYPSMHALMELFSFHWLWDAVTAYLESYVGAATVVGVATFALSHYTVGVGALLTALPSLLTALVDLFRSRPQPQPPAAGAVTIDFHTLMRAAAADRPHRE